VKNYIQFAVAVLALLLAGNVSAVKATPLGLTLRGRVVDENGLPVSGAQVKLEYIDEPTAAATSGQTAPTVGGRTFLAVSSDAGAFTLSDMREGEYTARVEKEGFFVLTGEKFELKAEAAEFSFTLNHEREVREKVDVVATANNVDPAETSQSETLTATEIRDIPVASSHDLQQSLVILPEILRDNQNLLHLAGARNTQALYLLDGFDIGNPTSGAFTTRLILEAVRAAEVRTSRFGAEFAHPGAALLSFDTVEGDDRWRFGTTDFIPGINVEDGVRLGNFYPRVSFSGPIHRGKLWFSQSFSLVHTLNVVKEQPSGANTTAVWGGDSMSRVLWHISTNDSLHIGFMYNNESDANLRLDAQHPKSTTLDVSSNQLFGSVKNQLWVHQTLFEVGFAVTRNYGDANPMGTEPYVQLVNAAEGNYFQDTEQKGRRYQIMADAINTAVRWHGTHTISAGGNLSTVQLISSATRTEVEALRSDLTLSRLTTFAGTGNFNVSNTLAGGFVQDSWAIDKHLVATLGVRGDWDRFVQEGMAEPRVSLNFLPFEDNRGKFSIGWGLYNIPLNLSVIGQTQDQQQVDTLYDATGTVATSGPATSQFVLPSSGLKQAYFDIASAGWQERFGSNTLVSVELLARDEHHGLVYETENPGTIGSVFLLQSSRRDKYRGATISARHTFANGAMLYGSYTRSRASSDQLLDPTLGAMYFAAQQPGALTWDAPNRVLSWGSIPTPVWGILFTYFFEYRTGYPFNVVNQQQFLIGAPNAERFPDYANLTIGLEKKFRFRGYLFAVRVAVINILGRENPDVVVNNVDAPNFLTFSGGQGRAVTARLRFIERK
jgi:hypothetical protein